MKMGKILVLALVVVALGGSAGWLASRPPAPAPADRKIVYYACPMHPSAKAKQRGHCRICGMVLEPVYGNTAPTNVPSDADPAGNRSPGRDGR